MQWNENLCGCFLQISEMHKDRICTQAQQKSTDEITAMWTNRKAFPQELSSNRIFHMSSKLHLFLLLGGRELLLVPLVLWEVSVPGAH